MRLIAKPMNDSFAIERHIIGPKSYQSAYADAKAFMEDNETRKERNFEGYKEARYALDPYKDFLDARYGK